MIAFYKFVPQFGMRDASPFCLKLMTYLRLADIPHETHEIMDPRKAPKQKMPYIVDNGAEIGDSELIIRHLKQNYGDPLAQGLSNEQLALAHAFHVMLAERFYWTLTHTRWVNPQFQPVLKEAWFATVPRLLRGIVANQAFKQIAKATYGHGIGRHSLDEIYAMGISDIDAVEAVLGDKDYFLDEAPREIDASIYAFLSAAVCDAFPSPIRDRVKSSKNLLAYIDRVDQAVFGAGEQA